MRLLCVRADLVDSLTQLGIPFERVTGEGLWGTDFQLIGITAVQRDVLQIWNVDIEDITPDSLAAALQQLAAAGARKESATQVRQAHRVEIAVPVAQGIEEQAPAPEPEPEPVFVERRARPRLRMSGAGRFVEGTLSDGKIIVGDKTYDSPAQASSDVAADKAKFAFWEYYDDVDGKWRMLDRDWDRLLLQSQQPQAQQVVR